MFIACRFCHVSKYVINITIGHSGAAEMAWLLKVRSQFQPQDLREKAGAAVVIWAPGA